MLRKSKIRKIFILSLFILSIIFTSIQFYPNNLHYDKSNKNNLIFNQNEVVSSSSDGYLSDYYINGSGNAQDVRIYATNDSYKINNTQYFEIPSLSDINKSYLSYGNFNFTFQNNYTTDYVLENTNALNANEFIEFEYDTDKSSITVNKGNSLGPLNLGWLVDGDLGTLIRFNASNGIINFTVKANFSGSSYSKSPINNLNFNREYILGLINQFSLISSPVNTYLTLRIFNSSSWKNVTKSIFIKAGSTFQDFDKRIINENLNFIDFSNVSSIEFYFRNSSENEYVIRLAELSILATYGFDLPFTNNNYIALEFDLKGKKSTVNGFYAWIRTLNLSLAANAELNITLYEANATIIREQSYLRENNLEPNYNKVKDSKVISGYHGDNLTYFEFNTVNTSDLRLYNYFIVIKSNQSDVYSLVTIPRFTFGDPDNRVDHQLRISNNGQDWQIARKTVPSDMPYISEGLDASSFAINVTRGYMPSDFWNSEEDNLNIQDIPIMDQIDSSFPYNESSNLTWGLGQWDNNFTVPISADPSDDFKIDLNWNKTIIKDFQFNVTYSVKAYWIELTTTTYNVTYDALPVWNLSFDLNLTHSNLYSWNFSEFWFVFPSSYEAQNITNPISQELYPSTKGESPDIYKASYDKIVVNNTLVNEISGPYTLQATSPNFIYQMHSFNKYADVFWETNGFMFGDNMTVSVDILDLNGNPPNDGQANVSLFYPENPGGEYPLGKRYDDSGIIKDEVLKYDFNNDTLLKIRNTLSYFGNYYLGFFWTNGSEIGCKKLKLYIDSYNVEMQDLFYEPDLGENVLLGGVNLISNSLIPDYSLLIATVNVTDHFNFYPVESYDIDQEYVFNIGNVEIPILLKNFLQNETILSPDEVINIKVTLQNMFELCDVDVKIQAQLLSLANENWIISKKNSSYHTLKLKGDPLGRDTQDFSLNLTIPHLENDGIWQGVNAPVRKGGVMTKISIFIKYQNEDINLGVYNSNNYALLINSTQSEFEGYLMSLKYDKNISGVNILKPFKRNDCIYLPNQTTILINIYDKNYVSSYNDFIESFSLKSNSIFSNVTVSPETPIRGQKFNLSAILTTEFDKVIPSGNVTLQYYDENFWENISSQITSNDGQINFEIDTLILDDEAQLLFRLKYLGDLNTLGHSENITVDLYRELNDLEINIRQNELHLYRNKKGTIKITLINTGESQLCIPASNISIITEPNLSYRIVEINLLLLNKLTPGESTIIIVEIDVIAIKQIIFNVSINARNIISNENLTFKSSTTFEVFDIPLEDYITPLLTIIIVSIIVLFWIIIYLFVRRIIRKIETPIEEPVKKKRKRGRYLKVSEIEKAPKEEKEKVKTTDLDSLLEEEGLKDKKKK